MAGEDLVKTFIDKVKGRGWSVVLPEGGDERIVAAARRLRDEDITEPIVLGGTAEIEAATEKAGVSLDGIKTINPKDSDKFDSYVEKYVKGRDNITTSVAKRLVAKPLFYGGMMVASGDADAMVGGAAHATASVIQAGALTVGLEPKIETISSYFVMVIPDFCGQKDKAFIYADCAVNIDPTAKELADIAIASAANAKKLLGEEPRVAMLSFSTKGTAWSPSVQKVQKALEIAQQRQPQLAIDGEFQADTAIIPAVAEKKLKEKNSVAGKANVLIFPNLDSANMAYKLTQYMAKAAAIGPFLQGFAKPVSDLSRGASIDDIISTTAVTLAQLS